MKKPVMQRTMFVAVGSPKNESKGILSGFDNEDEMENENEDRTPDNPEILANNIRGDMRSLDERYLELASLVGEEAAFQTPEEVIVLMQSQLAQQSPQGIAAVGTTPPIPQGGITSGMGQQEPVKMASGGDPAALLRAIQNIPEFGRIPGLPTINPETIPRTIYVGSAGDARPLSQEAARFIFQENAGRAGTLPRTIPATLRASTAASNILQNAAPYSRELYRTLMGTPGGRAAGAIGVAAAPAMVYLGNKLGGPEQPSGEIGSLGQPASSPEMEAIIKSIPTNKPTPPEQTPPSPPSAEELAVRNVGWQNLAPRLGLVQEAIGEVTPRAEAGPGLPEPRPEIKFPTVIKAPEKGLRERVKEKMDIYSELLGSDPEMRKAQALFLLAEAALNVAGARGKSTAERLATGLKGFPAGMAAIGAEAEKERRGVAAAALQAVESEIASEKKDATTIAREVIRLSGKAPGKAERIAAVLKARRPSLTDAEALQLGNEIDTGLVTFDEKTGEAIDKMSGTVRFSPYSPLGPSSVGFIDPSNPFARISAETLAPVSIDERKNLFNQRAELQKSIARNEKMLSDIYGNTIGFLPTIQSGLSRVTLATFGDTGTFGLTDVEKNQIRQNLAINKEAILKSNLRNSGRPSVYDQKKVEGLIEDPNKLFASPELVVSSVSNFIREDINELARIDAQLFGTPVKELSRIPTGSRSDPIPMRANIGPVLDELFTKRPNAIIWTLRPDGRAARITSQEYFAQRQGQ